MQIRDVMTSVVVAVSSDLSAELAWKEMQAARIHHLVVIDDGRIVGVLSDRDLGGTRGTSVRASQRVADLMSGRVIVASPETDVRDAAKLLRGYKVSCLPVLDGKTLVGIVTASDLIELVGRGSARQPGEGQARILRSRGPNSRTYAAKNGAART